MTETNHINCEHCKYEHLSLLVYPRDSCSNEFDKFESKDTKPTPNQTAKADAGKPIYTHVPVGVIKAVEKVRAYGNAKYHSPDNWKQVESQRYWDAAVRHVIGAWDDYTAIDTESGLPHIYHALCNLAFLAERMEQDSN